MDESPSPSFDSSNEGSAVRDVCPICLLPPSADRPFCRPRLCSHRFCVQDAERILLTKAEVSTRHLLQNNTMEGLDPHMFLPTLGRCPICRQALSLFDLVEENNDTGLIEMNSKFSTWPIHGKKFEERQHQGCRMSVSYTEGSPILSWRKDLSEEGGGQPLTENAPFHPGCHFHEKSRTFHGIVSLDDEQQQSLGFEGMSGKVELSCILQFASNLRFIAAGAMMRKDAESHQYQVVRVFGVGGRMLFSVGPASSTERPKYHRDTLWGNTFCQGLRVGMASYQFLPPSSDEEEGEAYISYEHPVSSQWPPLDDGSPIPSRVYFHDVAFDETERIFRGEIRWLEDFGTTWMGHRKWRYEMKFDSRFIFIASGTVHSFSSESDEAREMSTFGHELIYINAAIDERFRELFDTNNGGTTEEEESISDRYVRLSQPLRQEWASEQASVRVIATLHSTLIKLAMGEETPVDFNLI